MGNNTIYHPREWQQVEQHTYRHTVTHELIRHDQAPLNDHNNIASYAHRLEHQHTNILALLYYRQPKRACDDCAHDPYVDVWVEEHHKPAPTQDVDCVGLVRGCRYLERRYGSFVVGEDKIWIKNNEYKVWINSNPFVNTHQPATHSEMVESIIQYLQKVNYQHQHKIQRENFFDTFLGIKREKQLSFHHPTSKPSPTVQHRIFKKQHSKNMTMELKPPRVSFNYQTPKQNIPKHINKSINYQPRAHKAPNLIRKAEHTHSPSIHSNIPSISSLDNLRKVKAGVESDRTQVQTTDISHVRHFEYKPYHTPNNKQEKKKAVESEQCGINDPPQQDSSVLIREERPSNSSVHSHEPYHSSGSIRPNQNNTISHDKSPKQPSLENEKIHSKKESFQPREVDSILNTDKMSSENVGEEKSYGQEKSSSQPVQSRRESDYDLNTYFLEKMNMEREAFYERQDGEEVPYLPHDPLESDDLDISISYKIPQRTKQVVAKYLKDSSKSIQMPMVSKKQHLADQPHETESVYQDDDKIEKMLLESLRMEMFGGHAHGLQDEMQQLRKMYSQKDGEQEHIKKKVQEKKATFAELKAEAWKILQNEIF